MFFYTVLTYPNGLPDSVIDNLVIYANKFDKYIIVKEFGASGKNAHVNFVYFVDDNLTKNWVSNSRTNFIKCYGHLELPDNKKYLIKSKRCTSPENVIGGYLQKEAKAIIIKNVGFDIEQLKLDALDGYIDQPITLTNCADVIYKYQSDNRMPISQEFEHFSHVFDYMLRLGYRLAPLVLKQKHIYIVYSVKYLQCHSFPQI